MAGEWKFKRGIESFTKVIENLHYQSNVNNVFKMMKIS